MLKFIVFIILTLSSNIYADSLLSGLYRLNLTALDKYERYPFIMNFNVGVNGRIDDINIDYPSYNCKAKKDYIYIKKGLILVKEKIIEGNNICSASKYKIKLYQPQIYRRPFKFIFSDVFLVNDDSVKIVINKVDFRADKLGSYLIANGFSSGIYDLLKSNNINILIDFNKKNLNSPYYKKVENKIISIYRSKNTRDSYYKSYKITGSISDIKKSLSLSLSAKDLNDFLLKNSSINDIIGIKKIKIKLYRLFYEFNGFIEAFRLSKSKVDILKAFNLAKTNAEIEVSENELKNFLWKLDYNSSQCLIGNISNKTRKEHKSLVSICDSNERKENINALCFSISFGGCDAISSSVTDSTLLQSITTKECRKQISKMAIDNEVLSDLNSLMLTDIVAAARKTALSSNSLVQFFLGIPLVVGESVARQGSIDECIAQVRMECSKLYKVCR